MAHVQKKIKFFYYLKSYARIFFPKLRTKAHFDALKSQLKPAELEKSKPESPITTKWWIHFLCRPL